MVSTGAIVCNLGASITLMQRVARSLAHEERDLTELTWAALLPVTTASVVAALALMIGRHRLSDLITRPCTSTTWRCCFSRRRPRSR